MKLTKPELKVLERIFTAEIHGRLPAQLKSKHLETLESKGLVMPMEVVLPGRFSMTIRGWELTERGRYAYCKSCDDGKDL